MAHNVYIMPNTHNTQKKEYNRKGAEPHNAYNMHNTHNTYNTQKKVY